MGSLRLDRLSRANVSCSCHNGAGKVESAGRNGSPE
jgi:hypothetical protein